MTNAIQSAVYRPHRDLVWKESIQDIRILRVFKNNARARNDVRKWKGLYLSFLERSFVNQVHLFLRVKVTFDVGNTRNLVYK